MSIRTFQEQTKNSKNDPLLQALEALKEIENPRQVMEAAATSVSGWLIWTDED